VTTHLPVLPLWSCGGCGAPWPCAPRRKELRAEFEDAPMSLVLYLNSYLAWAAHDLAWVSAGDLYRRFVGWTSGDNLAVRGQNNSKSACTGGGIESTLAAPRVDGG
jgi:hypothetical protein